MRRVDFNLFQLVLMPALGAGPLGTRHSLWFVAAALVLSVGLLSLAILKVRTVTIRQSFQGVGGSAFWTWWTRERKKRFWWPGPSLDGNPILWREWKRARPTILSQVVWGTYLSVACLLTVRAVLNTLSTRNTFTLPSPIHSDFAALINAAMVSFGLLLVCVASVTSLAEERVRGSIGLLLASPLPTWSIVWGKWWGAYRTVVPLSVLPGVLAYTLAVDSGEWTGMMLIVGLILAQGAAITSMGLWLAARMQKPGRALIVNVAIYALVSSVWLPAGFLPADWRYLSESISSASPFFVIRELTHSMYYPSVKYWEGEVWSTLWIIAYLWMAAGLFVATLLSFDRRLGRMGGGTVSRFRLALPFLQPAKSHS